MARGRSVIRAWKEWAARAEPLVYRVGACLAVSFIDDPAWLAFMFC